MNINLLTIGQTAAANGNHISPAAEYFVKDAVRRMAQLTDSERVVIYHVLTDFYCPRCGIEQPPGDCQCGSDK